MMTNYEIKIVPNIDADGNTYWTASFPAFEGCVGCGSTAEEAVKEAQENLAFYIECMEMDGASIPEPYAPSAYSGKIALRVAKSTHERIAVLAKDEGVSINSLLNIAVENFLGIKKYEMELDSRIQNIQSLTEKILTLQKMNFIMNQQMALWRGVDGNNQFVYSGVTEE